MKHIVKKLLNEHGMTALLKVLIEHTDNSNEGYIQDLNKGFRRVKEEYDNRYKKYPEDEECEHNWVMDGHNAGDPICSKCYKRQ
jgi:hypothetical protein